MSTLLTHYPFFLLVGSKAISLVELLDVKASAGRPQKRRSDGVQPPSDRELDPEDSRCVRRRRLRSEHAHRRLDVGRVQTPRYVRRADPQRLRPAADSG